MNAEADAIGDALDGGYIRLYTGEQPLTADDPASGQLIAELRFGPDAFPPAKGGTLTANPIVAEPSAKASATAGWARLLTADGRALMDGSVGVFSATVVISTTNIVKAAVVSCLSLTIRIAKG